MAQVSEVKTDLMVIGRKRYPCCGSSCRLKKEEVIEIGGHIDKVCSTCNRRWRMRFVEAAISGRYGRPVAKIEWVADAADSDEGEVL